MISRLASTTPSRWYRIVEVRGDGGFGTVYECEAMTEQAAASPGRFAVKVLRDAHNPEHMHRFAQEARLLGELNHPHLMRVLDVNLAHDPPFFVMELMKETLLSRLQQMEREGAAYRALPAIETVILPLARAVDYLHARGIFHRDINPANIFFDAQDQAVLGDFGISREADPSRWRVTRGGLGTPGYTAPETLRSGVASPQSDIYSLGVVFYLMITGRRPLEWWWRDGANLPSAQHPHSSDASVDRLLMAMTHPEPSERYRDVRLVLHDLERVLRGSLRELPAYRALPVPEPARRFGSRLRALLPPLPHFLQR